MVLNLCEVLSRYNERHRFYHTATHIRRIFEFAQKMNLQLSSTQNLAIFFHDAIYEPSGKMNEENSADLLYTLCYPECEADNEMLKSASSIILATKHHVSDDQETGEVLDLDLMEIGLDWDRFCYNNRNIRKEFSFVSDEKFNEGRRNFFQSLLEQEHIFNTLPFRNKYEEAARTNILLTLTEIQ